jgi:hypothetical protein
MTLQSRYIPKDSQAIEHPLGVAYVQDLPAANSRMKYLAIAYAGKANKKSFYESYATKEARDKRIADFFAGLESWQKMKAERRAESSKPHTLKVGDILHHSWGWEQTQCDYYQILAVTPHGATIQAIISKTVEGSTVSHGMADRQIAIPDSFHGEPLRVKIDGFNRVCVSKGNGPLSHGSCGPWDGKPQYCSWYA